MRDCPAGIDVPRYIGYLALGKYAEAKAVVRERVPLPSICAHVCYRPCEPDCRRIQMDAPVAINALKRAAVAYGRSMERQCSSDTVAPDTGKRVAIVGSGPGGLTAAYYLGKRCGHQVTVFESQPDVGGQLRIGIPAYRLPREALEEEIAVIAETRVEFRTSAPVQDLSELLRQGYDAALIAIGAMRHRSLGITGEELPGVLDCVGFLQVVNYGERVRVGRRVAVIGGGNVAMDGARTARRLGAREVRILYRRTRREMPAYDFEAWAAQEEGVGMDFLVSPRAIARHGEGLRLNLIRMELGEPDESGRRRPVPVPDSDFTIDVDTVLVAIGQEPTIPSSWGLALNRDGSIQVDPETLETCRPGLFACGDVITGPANVIEAIAGGRQAAQAIDLHLGGDGDITERWAPEQGQEMVYPEGLYPPGISPFPHRKLPYDQRVTTFEEVEHGLTPEDAVNEALRCIRCDLWRLQGVPSVWPKKCAVPGVEAD